jgi:hypothetical protein
MKLICWKAGSNGTENKIKRERSATESKEMGSANNANKRRHIETIDLTSD